MGRTVVGLFELRVDSTGNLGMDYHHTIIIVRVTRRAYNLFTFQERGTGRRVTVYVRLPAVLACGIA